MIDLPTSVGSVINTKFWYLFNKERKGDCMNKPLSLDQIDFRSDALPFPRLRLKINQRFTNSTDPEPQEVYRLIVVKDDPSWLVLVGEKSFGYWRPATKVKDIFHLSRDEADAIFGLLYNWTWISD
jgi:hypothetical protein